MPQVGHEVTRPLDQVAARCVEGVLERSRIAQQCVRRRQCGGEHRDQEPCPLALTPVGQIGLLGQLADRFAGRQVPLHQPVVRRIGGPGRVLETPVTAFGLDVRPPDDDLGQFPGQLAAGLGDRGDLCGYPNCGAQQLQPVDRADIFGSTDDLGAGRWWVGIIGSIHVDQFTPMGRFPPHCGGKRF